MATTEEPTATPTPRTRKAVPTVQQIIAFNLLTDAIKNGKAAATNIGDILRQAGFAESVAKSPGLVTERKGFKALMDKYYPEEKKAAKHIQLLEAVTIDHYTFPLKMTDEEMTALVEQVPGCEVKKIVHGEKANTVYFFMPDAGAQLSALDKLYKISGDYSAEKVDLESSKIDEALDKLAGLIPE